MAEPLAVATAAVRDATNQQCVLAEVRARTGLGVHVLSGDLAARDWIGLRAGPIVLLDIGGGSLEIASGRGRTPDFAVSLPLGVARLTREHLDQDATPTPEPLRRIRRHVRHELRDVTARMQWEGPRTAVATSRTFHKLGKLCGTATGGQETFVPDQLDRHDLKAGLRRLAELPAPARAELPGISSTRTRQCLTGAIIAHTAMRCSASLTSPSPHGPCEKASCSPNCRNDASRASVSAKSRHHLVRHKPVASPPGPAEVTRHPGASHHLEVTGSEHQRINVRAVPSGGPAVKAVWPPQRGQPVPALIKPGRANGRQQEETIMPAGSSPKRERQYEHIKDSAEDRGASKGRAKEIAARTVNKERAQSGEAKLASRSSTKGKSPSQRAGEKSGSSRGGAQAVARRGTSCTRRRIRRASRAGPR